MSDESPKSRGLVILHAGTHKTGTTALQTNFAQREAALWAAGILYPATGRVGAGHHNLAWELLGDERFDPDGGTLAMLSEELGATSARIVLVSSEDFECLHARPLELDLLRGVFERAGFSVRVVLAIREPGDYAASLYDQLLSRGLNVERAAFVDNALRTRRVRFKTQDYSLDGAALVAEFSAAFGEGSTSSFPYDASNIARRFSAHLGSALGVELPDLDEELRENTRSERLDTLARRLREDTRAHGEAEAELNDALADARQSQARTEAELAELTLRLEGVVHELTALRESTSWRLTAPLRRVTDLLRRSGS